MKPLFVPLFPPWRGITDHDEQFLNFPSELAELEAEQSGDLLDGKIVRGTRATVESIGADPQRSFLPTPTRREWGWVAVWITGLLIGTAAAIGGAGWAVR